MTAPTQTLGTSTEAFHAGEQALQARVGVRERMAAAGPMLLRDYMPDQHRELFEKLPTLLLGALDAAGQPWATMVAGAPGFVQTPDMYRMQVNIQPDAADPVLARIEHKVRVPTLIARREGDTYTFDIHLQGEKETVFFDI